MIPPLLCFYLCFILLPGCIAPKTYTPIDGPVVIFERRVRVKAIAEDDPCSKKMWLYMEPEEKQAAAKVCEEARIAFIGLLPNEVKVCPKASEAECRPLPTCENLMYGCSFMCIEGSVIWSPTSVDGLNRQQLQSEKKVKHLQSIVKELPENPTIEKRGPYKKTRSNDDEGSSSGSRRKNKRKTTDLFLDL